MTSQFTSRHFIEIWTDGNKMNPISVLCVRCGSVILILFYCAVRCNGKTTWNYTGMVILDKIIKSWLRIVHGILKPTNFHWTVAMKSCSYLISLNYPSWKSLSPVEFVWWRAHIGRVSIWVREIQYLIIIIEIFYWSNSTHS